MWKFWGLHFSELKSCASCVSFLGRKSVQKTAQLQSSEVRRTAAPQSSMTLPAGNTFGRGMIGPVTSMRQLLYYFKKNIQYFFILKGTLFCACPKRSFRNFRSKHRPFSPPPQGAQTSQTWSTAELTCPQGHKATRPLSSPRECGNRCHGEKNSDSNHCTNSERTNQILHNSVWLKVWLKKKNVAS